MSYLYAPGEIASFLLEEKLAIHGVSPAVYQQNQGLIHELGRAASASSDALISVQIIGSRSNGTSGLTSDLNLVAVTFETDTAQSDREKLVDAAEGLKIETDISLAVIAIGIQDTIPVEATNFISLMDSSVSYASSLFEEGIFASPDQRLGQLAVTSILRTYPTKSAIAQQWEEIRLSHAEKYLGDMDRMHKMLAERLGNDSSKAIKEAISIELIRQRHAKFALPRDLNVHHNSLQRWANKNKAELQKRQGWQLYENVINEL